MASILETFVILFESNAEDVEKGNDSAKRSADRLQSALANVDDRSKTVGDNFLRMASTLGGAIGSVIALTGVTSAVLAAANNADALGEFSERLELNIEDVNAWGDAVQVNGGTAEGFRASVDNLIDGLVTFATKGTSRVAPFFKELGIQMVDANGKARNVMDILPELADAFEGLSKQESAGLGRKLGLDQGTIMLLQRGRREVDAQIKQQKELGTVTKEAAEIAGKFNDEADNTAKVFRSIFTAVGTTVLPVFTAILTGVGKVGGFLAKHSDFIVGLMIALGAAITIYALPPLITMAVAVVTAFAPFLLMGAIIAGLAVAFALLYDDIMNFIDGNDSLIGQILTEFPIIGQIINGLIDTVKELWGAVSWVFESILSILQISVAGWGILFDTVRDGVASFIEGSSVMQTILGAISAAFQMAGDVIGAVWDFLGGKAQGFLDLVRIIVNTVKMVAGGFTGALNNVKATLGIGGLPEGQAALGVASSSEINTQTSNTIANSAKSSSKTSNVNVGTVTVQTQATDAEGIAGAIGDTMGKQIRQASNDLDDGVRA